MDEQPPELVGTWQCVESVKKSGDVVPYPDTVPRVTYCLRENGSGILMPGTIAEWPMRWSVKDGRLSVGATSPKSKSTHVYELAGDTLVLHDGHGGRNIFKRQPEGT